MFNFVIGFFIYIILCDIIELQIFKKNVLY